MISVPCGTGDIADAMISASQMIYALRRKERISYRASDISLKAQEICDIIQLNKLEFV